MATKNEIRNVNIIINGKEVQNNIKSIGAEYKKAKNELAQLTIGSDQYNKKLKEVKNLKNVLTEHNKQLGFVQSSWQKLKSGITSLLPALSLGTLVAGAKRLADFANGLKQSRNEVKKLTDLTGPALDNTTARALAIADTYDKDFNKVLESTNNLASQMNISFGEAFDLIEKGFQAGADVNGEFLDNLREYPAYFKEAGYNAEQFITTITKQTKSGIFSDKGIDAIKEANLRLREMTPATKQALETLGILSDELSAKISSGEIKMSEAIAMVSQKIGELPAQSQAVGQALADIFGGPGEDAGVQFISTLSDVNTELEDMIDNNDDLVKAQQNNLIATTELNEAYLKLLGEGSAINRLWAQIKANEAERLNDIATILTSDELTLFQKLSALGNATMRSQVATSIQLEESKKAEKEAYEALNRQLILMAQNMGIEIDLTGLTNQEIQDLIDKKKAQIEAERQLAKAEDDRKKKADKLYKEYLKAEEKLQEKIREIREQLNLSTLSDQAKELQEVKYKYDQLEKEAEKHSERLKELEELRAQEIAAVNKKYEDDKVKKRAEVEQKINEMLLKGKNKEIYLVDQKYKEIIKMAKQFGFDTSELFTQMQKQIEEIEEKFASNPDHNLFKKIFGLDEEGWEDLQQKFNELIGLVDNAAAAYSAYANLRKAQDDAEMQRFEKNTNDKKIKLQKLLERGIISQEEYTQKTEELDKNLNKKKAELMAEQSERQKASATFNALINTAAAIIGFMADPGGWPGVALSALAALTGGLQIAAIQAEPIPAYEGGGYKEKEGLAILAEGNKKEGILSNATLTDPELGPIAEYLMNAQAGSPTPFPITAIEVPDNTSVSRAMDYNAFQRSGGIYTQNTVNNYYTTTTEQQKENLDNTEFAKDIKQLKEYMSDPVNRQAYINYDKKIDSENEMNYLNNANKF